MQFALCSYNRVVPRFLILLQLLLLNLPTFAAVAVVHADRTDVVPICCRRNGIHHCGIASSVPIGRIAVSSIPQRCPYCPAAVRSVQHASAALPTQAAIFAQVVSHPSCVAQTLALQRIHRDRSRQKRGPPRLS